MAKKSRNSWNSALTLLTLAFTISVTAAAIIGHAWVAYIEHQGNLELERHRLQQELLTNALEGADVDRAKENLRFLIETGLLRDSDVVDTKGIRTYVFDDNNDPAIFEPAGRPLTRSFGHEIEDSKQMLAVIHEEIGHARTLYCGCPYVRQGRSAGKIDREDCGLEARRSEIRSDRIEWEHVVPAYWIGRERPCWLEGHPLCGIEGGRLFKGRRCCTTRGVDPEFMEAYTDLNNLFPAAGEINGDRSALPFGKVEGEPREYGSCDFEVGKSPKVAEPSDAVRGEIARAMLYMAEQYAGMLDMEMSEDELVKWHRADPPEHWEIERAKQIEEATGKRNRFIFDQ